jgi:hypothetical protein
MSSGRSYHPCFWRTESQKWRAVPPLTFPLPRDNMTEIRLKRKVTPKEFQKIKQLLDLSEMSFVLDENEADELNRDDD